LRGVAEKVDHRHSTKEAALEEDKIGVEMADHGALDLRKFAANFRNLNEVRQRRRIVAKQNCALGGREIGKGAADFLDVPREKHVPLIGFIFEQLPLEHGQRKQRSSDADQDVVLKGKRPEWFQVEHITGTTETFKPHAAEICAERFFAELMITDHGMKAVAELSP